MITAATTEEVIYRGFEFESLAAMCGVPVAAVLNLAAFAARHVKFFGVKTVLVRLPGAASLVAVYAWKRNLPVAMITHFVLDAPLLLTNLRNDTRSDGDVTPE